VDQDIGLASASSTNGQLTVSSVHGVSSLESNNSVPAELVEVNTQLRGGVYNRGLLAIIFCICCSSERSDVQRRAT
jgi:hypothetical protein